MVLKDRYDFILFATDTQLRIWRDAGGDGYSSADELFSLDELGIQSINTSTTNSTHIDPQGNEHRMTGSFTKTHGTTSNMADVWSKPDLKKKYWPYRINRMYLPFTQALEGKIKSLLTILIC